MAVPSDYAEARDPRTPPERLAELARTHPELQALIALNAGCPEDLRQAILRENPGAARVLEERRAQGTWNPGAAQGSADAQAVPTGHGSPPQAGTPTGYGSPSGYGYGSGDQYGSPQQGGSPNQYGSPDQYGSPNGQGAPAGQVPPPPAGWGAPSAGQAPAGQPSPGYAAADASGASGPATGGLSAQIFGGSTAAPGSPPPPPPGAQQPAQPAPHRRGRGATWALLGCLVLLIPLLIGGFFAGRHLMGADEPSTAGSTSSRSERPRESSSAKESSAPASSSASPSPTTEAPDVRPAPAGAVDLGDIVSPSGNIQCTLDGDTVGCSLAERDFSGTAGQDCAVDQAFSLVVGADAASLACGQSFGSARGTVLQYGSSAARGDVACTSEDTGMTCWNVKTGHGFTVNKVEHQEF